MRLNKRAQSTAEYAVVIAIVLAAAVGMQTYVKRALQAKMRGATGALINVTGDPGNNIGLGNMAQYEPYTADSAYNVDRRDSYNEIFTGNNRTGSSSYTGALSNTVRTGRSSESVNQNGEGVWR